MPPPESLTLMSRWFDWRSELVIVRPETLIGWHRTGFRLWWRWKSRSGWPPIPKELRELSRRMAREPFTCPLIPVVTTEVDGGCRRRQQGTAAFHDEHIRKSSDEVMGMPATS